MLDKRTHIILPLLLAVFFAGGMIIGAKFNNKTVILPQGFGSKNVAKNNKLSAIVDYIEQQYVDTVQKELIIDETIQHILQQLDPHSYYISALELQRMNEPLMGNFEGIGVQFSIQKDTVVVISPVSGGPSEKVGIVSGDRIIAVDGKIIAGVNIKNMDVMNKLRGKGGTTVAVDVQRNGKDSLLNFEITRDKIPIYSVESSFITNNDIGYIKISRFSKTTYEEFKAASDKLLSEGMNALILDLRGNGGGYLEAAIDITDEFLEDGQMIVYTEGRARKREHFYASSGGALKNIGLTILIDEGSASASEIVAGAVQDNDRGTIIGRRSFGKGLVQEQSNWPDGSATRLTIARYYTPTGRCIQKAYEHGAVYDSTKQIVAADTLKYTTPNGKIVYGGGGIYPDILMPLDSLNSSIYLAKLFYSGSFYKFSFDYADKHREKFNAFGSSKNFVAQYSVSENLINEFIVFAAKEGVKRNEKELLANQKLIKARLKAGIGRNIFGDDAYYPVILEEDPVFQKAISQHKNLDLVNKH